MKRSRRIRLALLGSAGLMTLTACDQADDPLKPGQFFADAQACEAAYDAEACRQAFTQARQEHVRTAPKFADRAACEAEFGAENCVAAAPVAQGTGQNADQTQPTAYAGGGWFMPAMLGYMMGRMSGGGYAATPLYRDTQNNAYSGRQPLGRIDSARMPPPQRVAGTAGAPPFAAQRSPQSTPRAGFGRMGGSAAS